MFELSLTNRFGDDPGPVAAFAVYVAALARLLIYLLSGAPAVRADVLARARRAGLRMILGL